MKVPADLACEINTQAPLPRQGANHRVGLSVTSRYRHDMTCNVLKETLKSIKKNKQMFYKTTGYNLFSLLVGDQARHVYMHFNEIEIHDY